jgi:hypothetical protein
MKLAEVFKQAITDGDWYKVCDVYKAITGEPIQPPQQGGHVVPLVEELADIEMGDGSTTVLTNASKQTGRLGKKKTRMPAEDFTAPSRGNIKNSKRKRQARREPVNDQDHTNKFRDDRTVAQKDIAIDQKLAVKDPLIRGNRQLLDIDAADTGHTISVQCSQCDVREEVSPALAHGYDTDPEENVWKCNDCCTPSGRNEEKRRRNDG